MRFRVVRLFAFVVVEHISLILKKHYSIILLLEVISMPFKYLLL